MNVVTTAHSYESLHAAVDQHQPDAAVVELTLLYEADAGAFGALEDLATRVAVVVTGDGIFPADVLRTFRAGARGVVIKDDRPEKLLEAITVAQDRRQRYIDPRLAPDLIDAARKGERGGDHPFGLTTQQLRVVRLIADGHTSPEIARRLGISPETVKSHVDHASRLWLPGVVMRKPGKLAIVRAWRTIWPNWVAPVRDHLAQDRRRFFKKDRNNEASRTYLLVEVAEVGTSDRDGEG